MKPDAEIPVTLTAAEWAVVRRLVGRGAHDEVAELIYRMTRQLVAAEQVAE